jgi:hypothetical protein
VEERLGAQPARARHRDGELRQGLSPPHAGMDALLEAVGRVLQVDRPGGPGGGAVAGW